MAVTEPQQAEPSRVLRKAAATAAGRSREPASEAEPAPERARPDADRASYYLNPPSAALPSPFDRRHDVGWQRGIARAVRTPAIAESIPSLRYLHAGSASLMRRARRRERAARRAQSKKSNASEQSVVYEKLPSWPRTCVQRRRTISEAGRYTNDCILHFDHRRWPYPRSNKDRERYGSR